MCFSFLSGFISFNLQNFSRWWLFLEVRWAIKMMSGCSVSVHMLFTLHAKCEQTTRSSFCLAFLFGNLGIEILILPDCCEEWVTVKMWHLDHLISTEVSPNRSSNLHLKAVLPKVSSVGVHSTQPEEVINAHYKLTFRTRKNSEVFLCVP